MKRVSVLAVEFMKRKIPSTGWSGLTNSKILSRVIRVKIRRLGTVLFRSLADEIHFFIVDTVKNVLGLNPLLVTYNRHYNSRAGIENITRLRTELGCDIITQTLRPSTVLKVIQASLKSVVVFTGTPSPVKPCFQSGRLCVTRFLSFGGTTKAWTKWVCIPIMDRVEMTKRYRLEHDLMGVGPEDLVGAGPGLTEEAQHPYLSFRPVIVGAWCGGIYLGNYLRWDTLAQHRLMKAKYNYYTGPLKRTFDECNDVDCEILPICMMSSSIESGATRN